MKSAIAGGLLVALAGGSAARDASYRLEDFAAVPKIDAHVHVHGEAADFMALAARDGMRILMINVDYPDFPPVAEQQRAAASLRERFPGRVAFAATFTVDDFASPSWAQATLRQLQAAVDAGAVGVKIWKNIGMTLRDPDGRYVMPDDARFEPVWQFIGSHGLVLLGHQAEPLNCWLPLARMTVASDREYFTAHPQYYMYRHPEMPSHETILAARDRMLASHPGLRFDAVHLASLEWDVDRVAAFLDRFPQASVDLAARLVHLEYQASIDRGKVRRFLIRYQDRVLYGSDDAYGPAEHDAQAVAAIHDGWVEDWRFLATGQAMHSGDFRAAFRGLALPRAVVDRIYWRNAEALFPGAWAAPAPAPGQKPAARNTSRPST